MDTKDLTPRLVESATANTDSEIQKLLSSEGYKTFIACTDAIRGKAPRTMAIRALMANLGRWFEGYLGHNSVEWDSKSVKLMASQLRAIQKYYPSKVPKVVYRVTDIPNHTGLGAESLLGRKVIEEPRPILSFSGDSNYPKTFWFRVRGADIKEVITSPNMLEANYPKGRDSAAVIYEVPVTAANLAGTHESCVLFAEAVEAYYGAFVWTLRQTDPRLNGAKFRTGSQMIEQFKPSMRPFIRRQREVILVFPNNKVRADVTDVIFNSADVRRKFEKQGKL